MHSLILLSCLGTPEKRLHFWTLSLAFTILVQPSADILSTQSLISIRLLYGLRFLKCKHNVKFSNESIVSVRHERIIHYPIFVLSPKPLQENSYLNIYCRMLDLGPMRKKTDIFIDSNFISTFSNLTQALSFCASGTTVLYESLLLSAKASLRTCKKEKGCSDEKVNRLALYDILTRT